MNVPGQITVQKHKLIIHIAPVILIIQRISGQIQRKTFEFSNFNFLALKSLSAAISDLSHHY